MGYLHIVIGLACLALVYGQYNSGYDDDVDDYDSSPYGSRSGRRGGSRSGSRYGSRSGSRSGDYSDKSTDTYKDSSYYGGDDGKSTYSTIHGCPYHIKANPDNIYSFILGDTVIDCPYGTYFDADICTCNHKSVSKRGGGDRVYG